MSTRSSPAAVTIHSGKSSLQRVRLRWLTLGITLSTMLLFVALAALHQRAAPIALAGAMLVGAKGAAWLLILRHYRVRLRRNGYRW